MPAELRTGPFARLEWQKIKVNGYDEFNGDSSSMWFDGQRRFPCRKPWAGACVVTGRLAS